jgi:hypothetical protein
MKNLLCGIILLGALRADAQTPQYKAPYFPAKVASLIADNLAPDTSEIARIQCLYFPSEFVGAPRGNVKNVYFRLQYPTYIDSPSFYPNFSIRIGHTQRTTWYGNKATYGRDTFVTGLTTVYSNPAYTPVFHLPSDSPGTWIRFPVNAGNFTYDGSHNLVVELSYGGARVKNRLLLNVAGGPPYPRTIQGLVDTTVAHDHGFAAYRLDFGFDIEPTGVETLANIRAIGLFPNPASDGRFNVSLEAKKPVQEVVIRIYNSIGQLYLERRFNDTGRFFLQEFNLSGAPNGQYMMELMADGDKVSRNVVID